MRIQHIQHSLKILKVHHIPLCMLKQLDLNFTFAKPKGEIVYLSPNKRFSSTKQAGCHVRRIVNVWAQGLMKIDTAVVLTATC